MFALMGRNQAPQIATTKCRLESRDWRSLDQSKSIKTVEDLNSVQFVRRSVTIADVVLIGRHQATKLGQRIADSNRVIGIRCIKQNH